MNKEELGSFICEIRKEKNMTQKELADKLIISDKAVSKWERGLSYPDITLLEPLSAILGVSMTELIQGRRMDMEELKTAQEMVKETVDISKAQYDAMCSKVKTCRITTIIAFSVVAMLECILLFFVGVDIEKASLHLWTVEGLAIFFGIYFWAFAKDKIPVFYDENKISCYRDGAMQLSFPGISFNNSNWPHIINALRIWSIILMVVYPILTYFLDKLPLNEFALMPVLFVVIFAAVFSVFIPVVYLGKKYE